MLPASENNAISDSDPHEYLPACIQSLGAEAQAVFDSNFLPSPETFPFATAGLEQFVRARSELLSTFVQRLCAGQRP
jgi:hypothetical protein